MGFLSEPGAPLDPTRFLRIAIGMGKHSSSPSARPRNKDIKPANVLVDDAGNAWLTGFGIASQLPRERQLPVHPRLLPARSPI